MPPSASKSKQLNYLVDPKTGQFKALSGYSKSSSPSEELAGAGNYSATRYSPDELPPMVDMRPFMSPVENQAQANSCTANAVVGAYEYVMARIGAEVDFSRLFVYYNARNPNLQNIKVADEGSSIELALAAMDHYGVCYERTWDYHVDPASGKVKYINDKPVESAYEEASQLKQHAAFQWQTAESVPISLFEMKHCLAEGYPFVFGLALFQKFDTATKHGRVPMPDLATEEGRASHGMHAMLCVGYKDSAQVFIVRNSWGKDWGDDGYCYVPYEYMSNPELCFALFKVKGHIETSGETQKDLTEDIWVYEDEDFGEDFYAEEEEGSEIIVSLEEAIAILCLYGASVDGHISKEENDLLMSLFDDYGINYGALKNKMDVLTQMGVTCFDTAVQIVLAHKEAEKAYEVSLEFAFADGKITKDEEEFYLKLSKALELDPDYAKETHDALFEDNPETVVESLLKLEAPLKKGASGELVEMLQEELLQEGYDVAVNGKFSAKTLRAVKEYQEYNNLKVDGIVGQEMWDMLFGPEEAEEKTVLTKPLKRGSHGDQVKMLQAALNEKLGCELEVDGIFGRETKIAVQQFQRDQEMDDTDGIVRQYCWDALEPSALDDEEEEDEDEEEDEEGDEEEEDEEEDDEEEEDEEEDE